MSEIGYYRYKHLVTEDKILTCFIDDQTFTKSIKMLNECEAIILKYLDSNGQYRFYPFNKYYRTFDNPTQIGSVNKMITNILTDKSDSSNIGYKNERKIELTCEANEDQLLILSDIYTSPRVYLYTGTGSNDNESDWIEIKLIANENTIHRRKANNGRVDIVVTLPENYTITML